MEQNNKVELPFLKYPLLVCAPMVEQSEHPFRVLTRRYGCNLCYTPMMNSKVMVAQKNYVKQQFTTCQEDRPLVAQLCGNDPDTIVKAAKMVQSRVDAIDINLGCPQGIARKGHYGSFLLEEPEVIEKMVIALRANLKVPIFCKIRILKTEEKTMELVDRIQKAGCCLLTVHGRTKEQNKERVGECDWDMIKKIKERLTIPVVANGGIYKFQDVEKCLEYTGVDGVMSSQSLLQNPALFSGKTEDIDQLALEYLDLTEKYVGATDSQIRGHLFKMLFKGLAANIDLRERLVKARGIAQFRDVATEMVERRKGMKLEEKFGWYLRHWKGIKIENYEKGIHVEVKELTNGEQLQKEMQKQQNKQQQVKKEESTIDKKQQNTVS